MAETTQTENQSLFDGWMPSSQQLLDYAGVELDVDGAKEEVRKGMLDMLGSAWRAFTSYMGWAGDGLASGFNSSMDYLGNMIASLPFFDKPEHTAANDLAESLTTNEAIQAKLESVGITGDTTTKIADIIKDSSNGFARFRDGESISNGVKTELTELLASTDATYAGTEYSAYRNAFNQMLNSNGIDPAMLGDKVEAHFTEFKNNPNAKAYVESETKRVIDSLTDATKQAIDSKSAAADLTIPPATTADAARLTAAYADMGNGLQQAQLFAEVRSLVPADFYAALSADELANIAAAYNVNKQVPGTGLSTESLQSLNAIKTNNPQAYAALLGQIDDSKQAPNTVTDLESFLTNANFRKADFSKVTEGKVDVELASGSVLPAEFQVPTATPVAQNQAQQNGPAVN